jgi:chloramphenicol-sensitive protein RarD
MKPTRDPHETSALIAGVAAFVTWGLVPVYWKLLRFIPAAEILAHRFIWTCVFMVLLLSWQGRWSEVLANLCSRRTALFCAGSGIRHRDQLVRFHLGGECRACARDESRIFYVALVNVLLGAIFLRERLTRAQRPSVLLASGAVCYLTFGFGRLPWVASQSLPFIWDLRTVTQSLGRGGDSGTLSGNDLHRAIRARLSALSREDRRNSNLPLPRPGLDLLLVSTGIVTGLPLLWFRPCGAPSSPDTVGFLPYLSPSCTVFPRRLRLSRAVSPRSDADFRPHLDRTRHIHRRCRHALAFDESIVSPADRNVGQGSCLRFRMSKMEACATFLPHVERR